MSNSKVRKGLKNIVISILSEIIILILGLIVPRIIVISYGSEVNGLLSSTTQLLSYLAIFEAGISAVMCNSLYAAFSSHDNEKVSLVFQSGVKYYRKISVYYGLCLIIASFFFSFTINTTIPRFSVFMVVLLSGLSSVLSFLFLASIKNVISSDGNYYFISIMNLIIKVLTYGVMIVTALFNLDIVVIKAAGLLVTIIQILIYRVFFQIKYGWIQKVDNPILDEFKQRKYFVVHQIASLLFSCTDVMLLTFIASLSIVSIYTVYNSVISAIATMMAAVASSFLFILGQAYCESIERYTKIHDAFKLFYIELNFILITICYYLFLPFVGIYMSGADIDYCDPFVAFLFCVISLLNSSRMVDNNLATISWHVKQTMPHVIIEAISNVAISLMLVGPLKIYGVLLGTVVAIFFRVIIAPYYSEKYILHRPIRNGYKHALVNWCLFGIFVFIKEHIPMQINTYFDIVKYGIVFGCVISIAYILTNLLFFKKEYSLIIKHFKKRDMQI